jgi:hypothetical protein
MAKTPRLGNRIRHWQRDNYLDADEAAERLGISLDRYLEISGLARPTREEIEKIVAVTGIARKWLEDWAARPRRSAVTVTAPRV